MTREEALDFFKDVDINNKEALTSKYHELAKEVSFLINECAQDDIQRSLYDARLEKLNNAYKILTIDYKKLLVDDMLIDSSETKNKAQEQSKDIAGLSEMLVGIYKLLLIRKLKTKFFITNILVFLHYLAIGTFILSYLVDDKGFHRGENLFMGYFFIGVFHILYFLFKKKLKVYKILEYFEVVYAVLVTLVMWLILQIHENAGDSAAVSVLFLILWTFYIWFIKNFLTKLFVSELLGYKVNGFDYNNRKFSIREMKLFCIIAEDENGKSIKLRYTIAYHAMINAMQQDFESAYENLNNNLIINSNKK